MTSGEKAKEDSKEGARKERGHLHALWKADPWTGSGDSDSSAIKVGVVYGVLQNRVMKEKRIWSNGSTFWRR